MTCFLSNTFFYPRLFCREKFETFFVVDIFMLTLLNVIWLNQCPVCIYLSTRLSVCLSIYIQKSTEKHNVGLLILVPGLVGKSSIRWKVALRAWRGRERKRERGALTAIWAPPPPDPTCGRPRDGWPAKERNHLCSMPSMPEGHHLKLSVWKRQDFLSLSQSPSLSLPLFTLHYGNDTNFQLNLQSLKWSEWEVVSESDHWIRW